MSQCPVLAYTPDSGREALHEHQMVEVLPCIVTQQRGGSVLVSAIEAAQKIAAVSSIKFQHGRSTPQHVDGEAGPFSLVHVSRSQE